MTAYGDRVLEDEAMKIRLAEQGTRNNTVFLAALRVGQCIEGCGLDPDEVTDVLFEAALVSHLTTVEAATASLRDEMRATIKSGMTKGMKDPKQISPDITSRGEGVEAVLHILMVFMQQPRGGHAANRMHPTMLALCSLGVMQGGPNEIRAPMRKLRIISGVGGLTTISRAIDDLIEDGYVTKNIRGDGSQATSYQVKVPGALLSRNTPTHPPGSCMRSHLAHNNHDAFHRDALGRAGQRILAHLQEHPDRWFAQSELADEIGNCASTINRHVQPHRPLIAHGLVERGPRGQLRLNHVPTVEDLDRIAFDKRTKGHGDKRKRRTAESYREQGYLTPDFYWINQRTGETTSQQATWLMPSTPVTRKIPTSSPQPGDALPSREQEAIG